MTVPRDAGPSGDSPEDADSAHAESPYTAPEYQPPRRKSTDHSVFAEPWMQPVIHAGDVSDPGPGLPLSASTNEDQSVWDEPGLSRQLSGATPDNAVTWFRWYQERREETSTGETWLVTLVVSLISGIFAVIGTLASQTGWGRSFVGVALIGPTTEEIMKIALPLWLVEKRPWLYRGGGQILLCAQAGGLMFAVVENIIYLTIYVPNASPGLAAWRWTICVLLHAGCSTIAGIGVWTIWKRFQRNERTPVLSDGAPWIVAAIVIHGLYNASVTLLEYSGFSF